ncbi:hypothetical protein HD554DRAFT_2037708 [Boletus coccyginus]|nr:hypothetical protein HD554DRAFT_2037708 [Boletus coccyginus]
MAPTLLNLHPGQYKGTPPQAHSSHDLNPGGSSDSASPDDLQLPAEYCTTHLPGNHAFLDDLGDWDNQFPEGPDSRHYAPGKTAQKEYHPYLTVKSCDELGKLLSPGHPPSPHMQHGLNDWSPFSSQQNFLLADFFFRQKKTSAGNINYLMEL